MVKTADRHVFFYHALPPDVISLTLSDIHSIIKEAWLPRHDEALQSLTLSRRPGRPPSTKELQLSEVKLREAEEYRTGLGA
jgi:translation machinery-associated protein 16